MSLQLSFNVTVRQEFFLILTNHICILTVETEQASNEELIQ